MQYLTRGTSYLRTHSSMQMYAFSTKATQDIASQNFAKFQTKYSEFTKSFNDKLQQIEKDHKQAFKAPTGKAYQHPFDTPFSPVNFSAIKSSELFHDFVGPEQVSAHYENFLVARKWLIFSLGGLFILGAAAGTTDLNWIAKSSFVPFLFWMQFLYFYLEARKSMLMPLLVRFYRRVASNEIFQLETFYQENMELKIRGLLRKAKGQLEYGILHKDFRDVKGELINTFLMNEQMNLQKSISDRTLAILKQAQVYEKINQNRLLQEVIDNAVNALEQSLSSPAGRESLEKEIFDSALIGLSKGEMTYENDPLLPLILKSIQASVAKIQNLSSEEQTRLISLSKDQLQSIRDSDQRAKKEYLEHEPKIDSALKTNENVKRQLSSWGH